MKSSSKNIKFIDFEISSVCNANCPVCPRQNSMTGEMNPFSHKFWTLDEVKRHIDLDIVKNLWGLNLCGNFGDPMGNPEIAEICEYFIQNNPTLHIDISSNGGIGKTSTYEKLAKLGDITIRFAVDGYGEKNELYRVGVRWEKLKKNFDTFAKYCDSKNLQIQFLMWNETVDGIFDILDLLESHKKGEIYLRKPFDKGIETEVFDKTGCSTHYLTQIPDERLHFLYETRWKHDEIKSLKKRLTEIGDFNLNPIKMSDGHTHKKVNPSTPSEYQEIKKEFTDEQIEQVQDLNVQGCESLNFDNPFDFSQKNHSVFITHNKLLFPCCYIPPNVMTGMYYANGHEQPYQTEILNVMKEIGFSKFSLEGKTLSETFDTGILDLFAFNRILNGDSFYLCKQICGKCA